MRALLMLPVAGLAALLVAGCDGVTKMDRSTEIQVGQQAAAQLEAEHGVVNDPAATARVTAIGTRVAAVTDDPSLPYTFKILNSKDVNAVTLPGGFIYVYRGMMDFVGNDDSQLAGVIGHETTHAAHHHAAKQMQKALPQELLVALLTQHSGASVQQAANVALELALRGGSREDEYEADHDGTIWAYRAGFPANGLLTTLQRMYQEQGDTPRYAWLLQSHPPLSKRIQRLQQEIPQVTGQGR